MKPPLVTRVPQVLDGLQAILSEREGLAEVQILDGPVLSLSALANDSICVGPGTPEEPGYFVTYGEQTGLGRVSYVEQVEVTVAVATYSGATDMKARRDRVTELLGEIQQAVSANQVRPDAWDSLTFGPEAVWHPVQSKQGATMAVGITLVSRAII